MEREGYDESYARDPGEYECEPVREVPYPIRCLEANRVPSLTLAHAFDRVTVSSRNGAPLLSFIGVLLSDYASGPSLGLVADLAAYVTGESGFYGRHSARKL